MPARGLSKQYVWHSSDAAVEIAIAGDATAAAAAAGTVQEVVEKARAPRRMLALAAIRCPRR